MKRLNLGKLRPQTATVWRLSLPTILTQITTIVMQYIDSAMVGALGALRGAGDTLVPSLLNLGSIWIVRIGLALILVKQPGLHGMWIAMVVELCMRGLLMLYRQRTSKFYAMYAGQGK